MADVLVPVTHRRQETLYYCGPATGEMVLRALGVASPAIPPSWQEQLWTFVTTNTGATRPPSAPSTDEAPAFPQQKCEWCDGWECWSTTPAVLQQLLNTSQAVASYSVTTHQLEEDATAVLLDTLDAGFPGVALVYGWQHWLVVDGYRHSPRAKAVVGGRRLNGLYIRDPEVSARRHYIAWSRWRDEYLSFVACGVYRDSFLVMPAVPAGMPPPPPAPPPLPPHPISAGGGSNIEESNMLKPLLTTDTVARHAMTALTELQDSPLDLAMRGARPTETRLVQQINREDSFYYLVSFERDGRHVMQAMIDGFDGTLLETVGIEKESEALPRILDAIEAERRLKDGAGWFIHREGVVGQHPVLVWKPCRQSKSPFLPFYQFSVGNRFVYLRVDGTLFDALTTGPI
jgi:hypothetical protein